MASVPQDTLSGPAEHILVVALLAWMNSMATVATSVQEAEFRVGIVLAVLYDRDRVDCGRN